MILTGKARKDFENIYSPIVRSEIYEHALIVEWFDSVGIRIIVDYSHHGYWVSSVEDGNFPFDKRLLFYEDGYDTRQKATKQAILKSNEIYNDRHHAMQK